MPVPHRRRPHPVLAFVVTASTTVAATALLAPAASAAPPWSAPVSVGPAGLETFGLVTGSSGRSLAVGYGRRGGILVPVGADGTPGRTRDVADTILGLGSTGDRAVLLRRSEDFRRVGISYGTLDGRSLGHRTLLHRGAAADGTLAVGPRGDVLTTISSGGTEDYTADDTPERVELHWSAAGHRNRWRTVTLPGRAGVVATAVDDDGRAIVLLERTVRGGYAVTARTLRLRTGRLGPERTLGRSKAGYVRGSAALDGRGGAVVAWSRQDGGEEADTPAVVQAAFLRRGSTRFRPAVTLDPGGEAARPAGLPDAAMAGDGSTTVAWSQAVGGSTDDPDLVPRAAVSPGRTDRLGPKRDLLASGSVDDVAVAGTTTLVAASGTVAGPGSARTPFSGVLTRKASGALGTPEQVTTPRAKDLGALLLSAGPDGFRTVWDGAGDDGAEALRFAARPVPLSPSA